MEGRPDDPPGPATGSYRVRRGLPSCRSAYRAGSRLDASPIDGGFRVSLIPADKGAASNL